MALTYIKKGKIWFVPVTHLIRIYIASTYQEKQKWDLFRIQNIESELIPALWAYWSNVKTTTGFSPFQLVHEVEEVTPVECEILSLKIVIHVLPDTTELEEWLLHSEHLDEECRDVLIANEAHENKVKNQYDI